MAPSMVPWRRGFLAPRWSLGGPGSWPLDGPLGTGLVAHFQTILCRKLLRLYSSTPTHFRSNFSRSGPNLESTSIRTDGEIRLAYESVQPQEHILLFEGNEPLTPSPRDHRGAKNPGRQETTEGGQEPGPPRDQRVGPGTRAAKICSALQKMVE